MYYFSKETLLDKTYLLSCHVSITIVYPHFDFLKNVMNITEKEYDKITDLMYKAPFTKTSNAEIERLICDYLRFYDIEKRNDQMH